MLSKLLHGLWPFADFLGNNSAFIASLFIGITILVFVISVVWLFIKSKKISSDLKNTINYINDEYGEGLGQQYETLISKLKKDKKFGNLWQEFDETIVKVKDDEGKVKIFNTIDAYHLFNFDTIVKSKINIRFFNVIPGILTGLGLLGTFVGITTGLSDVPTAHATTEQLKEGIFGLLAGAQVAFSTSVWGILLSLISNTFEKWRINKLGRYISRLQVSIDSTFTKKRPEAILLDTYDQSKQQTQELKRFNTDLAFKIGEALNEGVTKNLIPVFDEILEAIDELRAFKEESATDAIGKLVDEFKNAMTAGASGQIKEMSNTLQRTAILLDKANEKSEQDQQMMKETLDEHLSSFKNSVAAMMEEMNQHQQSGTEQIQQSMENILARIDENVEKTGKQFEMMMDRTQSNVDQNLSGIKDLFEKLDSDFTEKIDVISGQFSKEKDSLDSLLDKIQGQVSAFNDSTEGMNQISSKLREIVPGIERTSTQLSNTINNYASLQEELIDSLIEIQDKHTDINERNEELIENIRDALDETKQHWSAYEKKFADVREDLNGVFEELEEGLNIYQTNTKNGLTNNLQVFDELMGNAIGSLSSGIDELKETLGEIINVNNNGAQA